MKAIQTFWINPNKNNLFNCGGWINKRYEYISWSLSFALLKRQFSEIILYGNTQGIEMLAKTLGLSYDKIHSVMDNPPAFVNDFWTIGKLATYATQTEPFVHVDGDVYWFKKADTDILNSEIIAQSLELDDPMYHINWRNSVSLLQMPAFLQTPFASRSMACNTGIIGGYNTHFFYEFYQKVVDFLEKNINTLRQKKEEFPFYEIYLEQVQLICYAHFKETNFKFLRKPVFRTNFEDVTNFLALEPNLEPNFIHLVATFKQRIQYCNQMEYWLSKIWPEQLEKINHLCLSNEKLRNEYRILLDPIAEKQLPKAEYLFVSSKDVLQMPYLRTNKLINKVLEPFIDKNNTQIINAINDEYISDAYTFESNRLVLIQNYCSNTSSELIYQHFEDNLFFFASEFDNSKHLKIKRNIKKTLKSKYNWFNSLRYDTTYYYDFQVSSDGICFQELLLPPSMCQLLDLLSSNMETSFEKLYEKWLKISRLENNRVNQKKITELIKELVNLQQIEIIS